jgi:hypothetical protein
MSKDDIISLTDLPNYRERRELIDLLLFRIPTRTPNIFNDPNHYLVGLWFHIADKYMVDSEYRYMYPEFEDSLNDQPPWVDEMFDIDRAKRNTNTWLNEARHEFATAIKPLYVQLADYNKHVANPNWSDAKLVKESYSRALLSKKIDGILLDKVFCAIIDNFVIELVEMQLAEVIVESSVFTGYSQGESCHDILFKIDAASYHAYPITGAEKKAKTKTIKRKIDHKYHCYWFDDLSQGNEELTLSNVMYTDLLV